MSRPNRVILSIHGASCEVMWHVANCDSSETKVQLPPRTKECWKLGMSFFRDHADEVC